MPGIAEVPEQYDPTNDWVYSEQCGCKVTFLGESLHWSSRMECCSKHDGNDNQKVRDALYATAKRRLKFVQMMGGFR
jgi:hypothetical protein